MSKKNTNRKRIIKDKEINPNAGSLVPERPKKPPKKDNKK